MAEKFISLRNLQFLLYEQFDAAALAKYPYFADHSKETFDMVLETAMRMARGILFPALSVMDREPPEFRDGKVFVHPVAAQVMKACGEGGWIGAQAPYELDGQQIPGMIMTAFRGIFAAANYSASVYPFLTTGAAHLILSFGSKELIETYVPKMFAGAWQGTMALTEPQAGSSLTDLATTAFPTAEGYYRIKGQKIFTSCSDYESTGNVVHLLLARTEGAPPGVKGISLFVVPKKRPDGRGGLAGNDVTCIGIYHKLGYRGAPITQLSFGDNNNCRGWLVGEPHKGLSYMFQMMNQARVDVGMGAAAIASAAYCASLEYARQRRQGRPVAGKDPLAPQVPIIEHADVKRMLLFQRAVVEGSLALIFQCAQYTDLALVTEGEEKERYELLLDLLTPIAKSYPSEMGILSVSQGLQCLGGYGYCDEFPLEQYYRDVRIHPIHEGTTGIQGMDLLGRKVVMKNGKALSLYLAEVEKAVAAGRAIPECDACARALAEAVETLKEVTTSLTGLAMKGEIEIFLADATLYLEFFGIVAIGWQWLRQAVTAAKALGASPDAANANFYRGKIHTCRYFFAYELPKIRGLAARLKESGDGLTVRMKPEWFEKGGIMMESRSKLAAPCGMYCGVCAIYIAHRDNDQKFKERLAVLSGVNIDEIHCKGCLSNDVFSYCRICPIRACAAQKGFEGCHQCADFPCGHIEAFPFPVGKKVILRSVPVRRKLGTERWMKEEEKRYHCPQCGIGRSRGARHCHGCGEAAELD